MRRLMFFYILLLLCLPAKASWQRAITNYARHSYKAASQNWMIMQSKTGWMYFANNKGLLEFDGVNWAVYPIHNAKMRTVKAGEDGRIYVGGLQQFGYFVPNKLGRLDYVCLSDSIDKHMIGNIWNIHIAGNRIYFQSDHAIFYLEKERLHQIACRDIIYSALVDKRLYVAGNGLSVLNGDTLLQLPNSTSYINNMSKRIVGIFPYQNKLLLVSNQHGLFLYENGTFVPFRSTADEFLKKNRLRCATMKGSLLALGTVQNGLLLLDLDTGSTEHISTHNGLQNKAILSLFFDREENLWLGLDNGID